MRMAVALPLSDGSLENLENLRLPVRLGQDAFTTRRFSAWTMQQAVDAFRRFRQVAQALDVRQNRVVATSAMREAENSSELIAHIAQETGFVIEVISAEEEARLIQLAVTRALELSGKQAMLIDIGGGSVEVTHSDGQRILSTHCYRSGTVRMLKKLEPLEERNLPPKKLVREYMEFTRVRIDQEYPETKVDVCVGTGGNIEEMGRLRKRLFGRDREDLISSDELAKLLRKLSEMSVAERIKKLGLRPDRADVILPATVVLYMLARRADVKEVLIPGVGLKDGVLSEMAQQSPAQVASSMPSSPPQLTP
jgi:exopolyphosphatase/guanosine-5'-triphosphate,3'-diphosphate pyrophosphatase